MSWQKITHERFWEALECLPPALMTGNGFLLGEPHDHRVCKVTGKIAPSFAAFVELKGGKGWPENGDFWEHEPMTIAEFMAVKKEDVH